MAGGELVFELLAPSGDADPRIADGGGILLELPPSPGDVRTDSPSSVRESENVVIRRRGNRLSPSVLSPWEGLSLRDCGCAPAASAAELP